MNDPKHIGDASAFLVAVGAFVNWLPPIAALASILWIAFQLWQHPKIQAWLTSRKVDDGKPSDPGAE